MPPKKGVYLERRESFSIFARVQACQREGLGEVETIAKEGEMERSAWEEGNQHGILEGFPTVQCFG